MTKVIYVKIRSWHIVREQIRSMYKTRCGRWSDQIPFDVIPAEKTCETCAMSLVREIDSGT